MATSETEKEMGDNINMGFMEVSSLRIIPCSRLWHWQGSNFEFCYEIVAVHS
jgi:hypothetical protein